MENIKKLHIHFIGIKGVGMASLAILSKEAGFHVTGCDIPQEFITSKILKAKGIEIFNNFSSEHLKNVNLVIATGAHGGINNPEVIAAKKLGIKVLMQGEAVGEFMQGNLFSKSLIGISVAGCHGKTTTTSLLGTIFTVAGLDPSYIIGTSEVFPLGFGGHYGSGKYFIAEADEYANDPLYDKTAKFLYQDPEALIINNIDFDHPDIYKDLNDVKNTYYKFAQKINDKNGVLIVNGDDKNLNEIRKDFVSKIITFGKGKNNDYYYKDIKTENNAINFKVVNNDKLVGEFEINLMGEHNVMNSLAVIVTSIYYNVSVKDIKKALLAFKGSKRRLEIIGYTPDGALIIDDYAHHPTEIIATLTAVKNNYPNKKIISIFQPHTYSRTKYLFDQFIDSLSLSDEVILAEVFKSLRDVETDKVSSKDIVSKLKNAKYLEKLSDISEYLKSQKFNDDYIILLLGAGDVYNIKDKLVKK